ncbi:RNase H domain-containing protein [Trichonephila clavipes]|nr:RNase H domain-containing protein [Trichonephila clavipes]
MTVVLVQAMAYHHIPSLLIQSKGGSRSSWFVRLTKHQNKTAWITIGNPPRAPLVSVFSSWRLSGSRFNKTGSNSSSPLSRSDHIKTMKFSEGCKSFEMCTNCSSEPATPAHLLECLGLTKKDLADDPLLVLDFLKVYDVMDLV